MRLLVGLSGNELTRHNAFVSSFLLYDRQSLPAVLGSEYSVPEGVMRTFSDASSLDFRETLQRSGIAGLDRSGLIYGVPCLFFIPFLGKGVPEWLVNVSRLLVINDYGKELFVVWQKGLGIFATAAYGDDNFDNTVKSVFP